MYKVGDKKFYPYLQYKKHYVSTFMKLQHMKFTPMQIDKTHIIDNIVPDGDDDVAFVTDKFITHLVTKHIVALDNIVNPFTSNKLKVFSSYKVGDLREIASGLSLELTKIVGDKEKNKTKRDLYDEIKAIYNI